MTDSPEDIARQKAEWEAYETKELLAGRCPFAGDDMRPVIDWWGRRVLMCEVCDCFGYPLVESDHGLLKPKELDLTNAELDW